MMRLKADLHTHTGDDPHDRISCSAEMLIDAAAQLNCKVLAISCHGLMVYTRRLDAYAARRGVLLIPAIEVSIENRHVVLLNPDARQAAVSTFGELRRLGRRDGAILAPHPFYPASASLRGKLIEHIDLFDAIEYCSVYRRGLNMNRKAVAAARNYRLPLIGTSDAHGLPYTGYTFSWVEAEEVSVAGVIQAIRARRVSVESRPQPWSEVSKVISFCARERMKSVARFFRRGDRLS